MSWSVMVARTRMWRITVAIMRGGNFEGALWQRPQFARKRFSPSRRDASSIFGCVLVVDEPVDGASFFSLSLFAHPAIAKNRAPAITVIRRSVRVLVARLLIAHPRMATAVIQSATSCPPPTDLRRVPAQTAGRNWRTRGHHCGSNSSARSRPRWCRVRARQAF